MKSIMCMSYGLYSELKAFQRTKTEEAEGLGCKSRMHRPCVLFIRMCSTSEMSDANGRSDAKTNFAGFSSHVSYWQGESSPL